MYQCSKKLVTCKEHCCFDHSDFPAHSMFTSDVCWGSLGTSIFGNSSSAASNTRSRLPSRLSFRFLWLCSNAPILQKTAKRNFVRHPARLSNIRDWCYQLKWLKASDENTLFKYRKPMISCLIGAVWNKKKRKKKQHTKTCNLWIFKRDAWPCGSTSGRLLLDKALLIMHHFFC